MTHDNESTDGTTAKTNQQDKFFDKLDQEICWQWKWEKLNRQLFLACSYIIGICNFLILALAGYQVYLDRNPEYFITVMIAVLAAVITTLPLLSWKLKWQQRQQVHDTIARRYEIIKLKLETNHLDLPEALKQFERIHKKPPEVLVQQTP